MAIEVSKDVEIRNVQALDFRARREASIPEGTLAVTYEVQAKSLFNVDKNAIIVQVKFSMCAVPEDGKQDEKVVEIDAVWELTYSYPKGKKLSKEALGEFGKYNGVFNAWPYWREFVQNSVLRMGLPSLTVPVFRIPQPEPKSRKAKKSAKKVIKAKIKRKNSRDVSARV